ncbi:MAG: response regulator [candidate division KSB1 bacterium]|nr:response regulator [candidate division KSB1 bacterium]MDZ7318310.1 response regulator [candidate division KSB1 bacterium]MDZ7340727.1 response regulator [candidate division KSB1 bacterium]
MNSVVAGKVLFIVKREKQIVQQLFDLFGKNKLGLAVEHELGTAISHAQHAHFDVIVLDADVKGMPIEKTIQILRDIDPQTRIIVKTHDNSRELEAKVRKEKIYYYHLDSFGPDDLKLAIKNAIYRRSNLMLESTGESNHQIQILMVDENDDFLEIHRANLELHHCRVDISYQADEAYQKIKNKPPDLIMVDMDVPVGSDGLHFMDKFLNDEQMKRIPVLIFLSKTFVEKHAAMLERVKSALPTWSYLDKPVKIEDVMPQVEQLLSPKKLSLMGH